MVSKAANAPLYNFIDAAFGFGSVGGQMLSVDANGHGGATLHVNLPVVTPECAEGHLASCPTSGV
jgi:hypothetical protein